MKKSDSYVYPAVFTYAPGQEIAVVFPDLNCATSGTDERDALLSARELLGCVIFGMEEDGEALPTATTLQSVTVGENERAVLVDVFMPPVRLAQSNKSVSRTVTLPAWLNAAALARGVNFSQALQNTLINDMDFRPPQA